MAARQPTYMQDKPDPTPESLLVHSAFLKRVVRYMVTDGNEADDVVQEVWVAALKKPPQNFDAARSWLWRVASNVIRLRLRTAARVRKREQLRAKPEVAPSAEEIRQREAARSAVLESLLTLDPEHREVLLLRFFEELSWKDVAARLEIPLETARTRAKRARVALRYAVEERTRSKGHSLLALIPLFELQHAEVLPRIGMMQATKAAALLVGLASLGWFGSLALSETAAEAPVLAELEDDAPGGNAPGLEGAQPELRGHAGPPADPTPGNSPPGADGIRTRGRCVDEHGRPVANASVRLARVGDPRLLQGTMAETTTGGDGRFELAGEHSLDALTVRASKASYLPAVAHVHAGGDAGSLVLRRTGAANLVIRDRNSDEPLAGVELSYRMKRPFGDFVFRTQSDDLGLAAVDLPPSGRNPERTRVAVRKEGYAPRLITLVGGSVRGANGSRGAPREIYLEAGPGVHVRVVDPSGAAVPGVRVRAWSSPKTRGWHAAGSQFRDADWSSVLELGGGQTNESGACTIDEAPWGTTVTVYAAADGLAGVVILPMYQGRRRGPITLRLRPAMVIHGQVLAGDRGVPGARVSVPLALIADPVQAKTRLRGVPPAPLADLLRLTCDESGAFRSRPLPVATYGVKYAVEARAPGRSVGRATVPPDYDASAALRITLPTGRTQRVKVTDTRGAPIVGARVLDAFRGVDAPTDGTGVATISLPPEGSASLQALAPGYRRSTTKADGSRSVLVMRLERATVLRGHLRDKRTSQGVRARIVLHRTTPGATAKREFIAHTFTGDSGAFSFEDVGPGPWLAVVTRGGESVSSEHAIRSAAAPKRLVVPRAGPAAQLATIAGTVVDGDGQAVTNYSARLRPTDRPVSPYRSSMEGARFEFRGIPAGAYRLEIQAGARTKRLPMQVEAGSRHDELRITLAAWATLKGTILDLDQAGSTRPKMVQLRRAGDLPGRRAVRLIDHEGHFAFERLVAGTYRIALIGSKGESYWTPESPSVVLREGDAMEREIRLRDAGRIVVNATGSAWGRALGSGAPRVYRETHGRPRPTPLPGGSASPAARPRPPASTLALIRPDGTRVELGRVVPGAQAIEDALPPGTYEVVVTRKGAESRNTVIVRAGTTTTIEIR